MHYFCDHQLFNLPTFDIHRFAFLSDSAIPSGKVYDYQKDDEEDEDTANDDKAPINTLT